jgi:hypothetical protein
MANVLIATLRDELATTKRLERKYLQKIAELSMGSFVVRRVRGGTYAYLNHREGARVVQQYLGKATDELIASYRKAGELKKEYQRKLKSVREQRKILERALRGKAKQARD